MMKTLNALIGGALIAMCMCLPACSKEPTPSDSKSAESRNDDPSEHRKHALAAMIGTPEAMQGSPVTETPLTPEIGEIDRAPGEGVDPPSNISGDRVVPPTDFFAFGCQTSKFGMVDGGAFTVNLLCQLETPEGDDIVIKTVSVADDAGCKVSVSDVRTLEVEISGSDYGNIYEVLGLILVKIEYQRGGELKTADPELLWYGRPIPSVLH